jgi:hypothetical protein
MEDLRDQFDGVRGLNALSCCFHLFQFSPQTKTRFAALAESCAFFVMSNLTDAQEMLGE